MFVVLNEAVDKHMDGFFQQQEENWRLHKRIDKLQTELRDMQARLTTEREEFERRITPFNLSNTNLSVTKATYGGRPLPAKRAW